MPPPSNRRPFDGSSKLAESLPSPLHTTSYDGPVSTGAEATVGQVEVPARRARWTAHDRKTQLVGLATEVFAERGFSATTMDEIALRAGVTKPVLYQHFPSKLDLYLAVLDLHIDALIFDIQTAVSSTTDNADRVKATVTAYFDFITREGEAFRLLFESDMNVEPQVRERLNRMTYDCAAAFSAVIAIDTGLPKEASMMLAVGLIGTVQTSARHWLERDSKISREVADELVSNLLWRGISAFPKSSS